MASYKVCSDFFVAISAWLSSDYRLHFRKRKNQATLITTINNKGIVGNCFFFD